MAWHLELSIAKSKKSGLVQQLSRLPSTEVVYISTWSAQRSLRLDRPGRIALGSTQRKVQNLNYLDVVQAASGLV